MATLEEKLVTEWHRLNEIFMIAKKHSIESVMLACLASMNTIVRVLGYTPEKDG